MAKCCPRSRTHSLIFGTCRSFRSFLAVMVMGGFIAGSGSFVAPREDFGFTPRAVRLPRSDLIVYDDSLRSPWFDASWNALAIYESTEQARTGLTSIKVVLSVAWGFLSVHHGAWNSMGIDPDTLESLAFDLYAPTSETSISVFFENDRGGVFPKVSAGTPVEQTWVTVSIPMSQLNPGGQVIHRICLQELSGTPKTFFVDNLRFVSADNGDAPPPPVLAEPGDGATDVSVDPLFQWHSAPAAEQYRLQVSTSDAFSTTTIDEAAIPDTQFSVNGLANNSTYYWRVNAQNAAGTSGWSSVRSFRTTPALPAAPTLASPPPGAINQDTALVLRWNQVIGADSYRLQVSTTSDFIVPLLDQQLITTTSSLVTGLSASTKYYWRVNAKNAAGTSGWSDTWSFVTAIPDSSPGILFLRTTIPFPQKSNPSDYSTHDYRILGLPGASNAPLTRFLPGQPGKDWQAYWDNGAPTDYLVPYHEGKEFSFGPGKAFWILKTSPWHIDVTVPPCSLTALRNAVVIIHDGWNLITSPFLNPVHWSLVQSINATNELLYEFADGSFAASEYLEPFKGYYFFNGTGVDSFYIPLDPNPHIRSVPYSEPTSPQSGDGWRVRIDVASGFSCDSSLFMGVEHGTSEGRDERDVRKPGRLKGTLIAYFYRPEWDSLYSVFGSDIRPPADTVRTWNFGIGSPTDSPVQVMFRGVHDVPPDLDIVLFDPHTSVTVDLRNQPFYIFSRGSGTLNVSMGPRGTVGKQINPGRKYLLQANYPNPFNSSTIIPFFLPKDSHLSLRILDVLGRQVKTLATGTFTAGSYSMVWDGTDQNGNPVPSGAYFVRLSVGGGSELTRRLVLLK